MALPVLAVPLHKNSVPASVRGLSYTQLDTRGGFGKRRDRRGITLSSSRKCMEQNSLHLPLEMESCLLEPNADLASLPLTGECLGSSAVPALGARVGDSMGATCLLPALASGSDPSLYKQEN